MAEDLDFSQSRITWCDELQVGKLKLPAAEIVRLLGEHLTDERCQRLSEVVKNRSLHMVSVLENIYDRGNTSAVMRSAEAFGFMQMYLVDQPGARFKAANRVTKGTEKWLDVRAMTSAQDAVKELRQRGYQIWATDLETGHTIDSIDWSRPTAIVLGNEKDGVSPEMKSLVDGTFRIPMLGFAQSFNISVAGALLYYRAHLEIQKLTAGANTNLTDAQAIQVLANYYLRCFDNPERLLKAKL